MAYDYSKLRGRIKEKFGTQDNFAAALKLSASALSQRLNNVSKFTQDEIVLACHILQIRDADAFDYFLPTKFRKTEFKML